MSDHRYGPTSAGTVLLDLGAQTGALALAEADSRLWESVIRDVAEADRRTLTSIDFWLPR